MWTYITILKLNENNKQMPMEMTLKGNLDLCNNSSFKAIYLINHLKLVSVAYHYSASKHICYMRYGFIRLKQKMILIWYLGHWLRNLSHFHLSILSHVDKDYRYNKIITLFGVYSLYIFYYFSWSILSCVSLKFF